jgi:hypothetical protein
MKVINFFVENWRVFACIGIGVTFFVAFLFFQNVGFGESRKERY